MIEFIITTFLNMQPQDESLTESVESDYEGEIDGEKEAFIAQKWSDLMGAQVCAVFCL